MVGAHASLPAPPSSGRRWQHAMAVDGRGGHAAERLSTLLIDGVPNLMAPTWGDGNDVDNENLNLTAARLRHVSDTM